MELRDSAQSCLWMLFVTYVTAIEASLEEVQRHLDLGRQLLSKGQFADALNHYHTAIDMDPENYQALYWRATAYLAMGKSKAALPDLDKVVELKPDFTSARLQRGGVLMKQGKLDGAAEDFRSVLAVEPNNADATKKLEELAPIVEATEAGDDFFENGDYESAMLAYSKAIEVSQWNAELREKRAECYKWLGQLGQAAADLRATTKLLNDPTEAYYKITMMYYEMGDVAESLNQVRECLKLNPDHKECFAHYKVVKKLDKQIEQMNDAAQKEDWIECLDRWQAALKTEKKNAAVRLLVDTTACRCQSKAGHSQEAIALCSDIVDKLLIDDDKVRALCDLAEAHILQDDFDEAMRTYNRAKEVDGQSRRVQEGIQRVQALIKQASKKDYYKILGVPRNANKKQIQRAYRDLAQKWHPDNFSDDDEKKRAEAKFIDIASAKEVLTDPEKREKFDHGEDPLDPEAQARGGHGHPFGHGFNPFGGGGGGGGPFTFKFNFG